MKMATEYNLGDTVSFDDTKGMVVSHIRSDTKWYPEPDNDDEYYEIEASQEDPILLVAFEDGTTRPLAPKQVESATWDDVTGDMDEDEIDKAVGETELSKPYHRCEQPEDFEAFMNTLHECGELSEDELEAELASPAIDLPGANTAGIGFSEDPNGWDRSSYLKAWATFKGKWRICYPRMIRHFGPRMAKRWCSALKDEVYQTTRWRVRGW
jgi:hypothetical protein